MWKTIAKWVVGLGLVGGAGYAGYQALKKKSAEESARGEEGTATAIVKKVDAILPTKGSSWGYDSSAKSGPSIVDRAKKAIGMDDTDDGSEGET